MTDYRLENLGSIWLLRPLTDAARADAALDTCEEWQRIGEAIAVDPRCVADVAHAIEENGLTVDIA